jgi:predicted nucleic acid-binding Zn ribbon protein
MAAKKKGMTKFEKHRLRKQQIIFIIIGAVVILSMVISLVVNF